MAKRYLSKEKQKEIAMYRLLHPGMSYAQLAEHFGVGIHQVRYAVEKYSKQAEMAMAGTNKSKRQAIKKAGKVADEALLWEQYQQALAQLSLDKTVSAERRITLLNTLVTIRKKLFQMRLQEHLKGVDAQFLLALVRYFQPEATEEQAIEIVKRVQEQVRNAKHVD